MIQLPIFPKDEREPWRMRVRCRAAPRCVTSQAGFEPALPVSDVPEIFTTSVGLAARCGKPENKKIHLRRVNDAPLLRTSNKVRSVIGIRLIAFVPSDRPRALGHTPLRREPRDPGLPFRLSSRDISSEPCFGK